MKRCTLFFAMMSLAVMPLLHAQTVQITGKVTTADDGTPIPGVSVLVKGTTTGTTTDMDGNYSINVPDNAVPLVFSFVGLKTQEVAIAGRTNIDVVMEQDIVGLEEVVVTALGISREKKSLGYAVQDVKSEELNRTRSGNVINSLSGKVAGVNITSASGNLGGSSRITIRGVKSVAGNNQPLFVVDGVPMDNTSFNTVDAQRGAGGYDYGSMASDINPDDVESVSVLKGPSASALYGSRAANGVILITTKKGKSAQKGIGVEVNSSVSWENVTLLPKYQNLYGGGSVQEDSLGFGVANINGKDFLLPDYALDESWGPKYDPNIRVLAFNNLFDWEAKGKQGDPETSPWVAPKNDVESFFETGVSFNNNFAMVGNSDNSSFRLSYTNFDLKGYMPNSIMKRNTISFNGDSKLSKYLRAFTSFNYVNTSTKGRAETGYGDNNVMQKFNQWGQRQLDMKILSNYVNPDGTQRVWNRGAWDNPTPEYSDNPYWTRYRNYQQDMRNRFFGNVGAALTPLKWLTVQGKLNADYYNVREMERVAIGSQAESSYSEALRELFEINAELLVTAKENLTEDIDFTLTAGANLRNRKYNENIGGTVGGLLVPDLYVLTNSKSKATTIDYQEEKEVQSIFGSVNLGYKGFLYFDGTLRNDWSSSLPKDTWSFLYPSATISLIFSQLGGLNNFNWLNFGKLRAGWAQSGNDTNPYSDRKYYQYLSNFGSLPLYSVPNTLFNPSLKAELTTSYEFGAELKFLDNRVGVDFTYYNEVSKNQILSVSIPGAAGYGFKTVNAGKITNKGIEVLLGITPVRTTNFTWDISMNYAKNINEVVELAPGLTVYQLGTGPFNVSVNAEEKKSYGSLIGSNFVYDDQGNKLVNADGLYEVGEVESLGTVLPDYTLGIWNNFKVFGVEVSALVDIRKGGKLFSTTNMWGRYSGILEETVATNANGKNVRDPLEEGGGVLVSGVYGYKDADGAVHYTDADGNPSNTPVQNTTYVDAEQWGGWHYDGPAAQNIFKADYVKLREITVGYTFPTKFTGPVQNIKVSVFGRNLGIWGTDIKHIDPENTTGTGNIQGIEGGALPSLRQFGVNLSFRF
jgi:TonB-linked SusC/RagA family outer membrane protein